MPPTLSPQAARDRFLAEQKISFSPGRLAVECAVCGSDYGGTSWTTVDEARQLGRVTSCWRTGSRGGRFLAL